MWRDCTYVRGSSPEQAMQEKVGNVKRKEKEKKRLRLPRVWIVAVGGLAQNVHSRVCRRAINVAPFPQGILASTLTYLN